MSNLMAGIERMAAEAPALISSAGNLRELEEIRLQYLGRKGLVTRILHGLGQVAPADRPAVGGRANQVKNVIADKLEKRRAELEQTRLEARLSGTGVDVTLPGPQSWKGSLHPITRTFDRLQEIFFSMGFTLAEGPEVEDDFHNFDALNTPPDHPARDVQDTFYLRDGLLLRAHTSTVQVRYMETHRPPVRIISPGRVFRRDQPDPSHSPVFHQIEGLYVDQHVTFGDLKYALEVFARQMFGPRVHVRFRPSFFPFTEPSAEMDLGCVICLGKGCGVCKQTGWVEVLGCGMVHPAVFESVGYDPEKWTGFAFGMGIERICMMLHGIDDIRLFLESDMRFLSQF